MNVRIAAIILGWFILFGYSHAEENPGVVWTTHPINRPWVLKGKIVAYDPGRANDRFYRHAVYFDGKGKVWPLLGGFWNVVQMIRSEFPDGMDRDFAQGNLVSILTEFNDLEDLIADDVFVQRYIDNLFYLAPDKETQKLVGQLLDKPVIRISGNEWSARFMTLASCDRIRINSIKGILKPFSIESEIIKTITDEDSNNLTAVGVRAALDRKKTILAQMEKQERAQ